MSAAVSQVHISAMLDKESDDIAMSFRAGDDDGSVDEVYTLGIGGCASLQQPFDLGRVTLARRSAQGFIEQILLIGTAHASASKEQEQYDTEDRDGDDQMHSPGHPGAATDRSAKRPVKCQRQYRQKQDDRGDRYENEGQENSETLQERPLV
jgi:hypothetical protein